MKKFFSNILAFLKKRWKLLLIVLIAVAVIFGFLQNRGKNQVVLNFVNPIRKDLVSSITISGRVDAKEKAQLRFVAGGKVVYLGAKQGDLVKKWQSLATIDRSTLQKQLNQDLNNYMKERYDFENTRDDIKDRTLETEEVRSVAQEQYDLDNQVLNVEIQNIAIANTTLSAPFEGILTVAPTNVTGVQLLATDYFEVVNPKTLIFRATIDEIDMHRISKGQSGQVILDAYDDEKIDTYISYVAYTSSETSSGTVFIVEFPINSQDMERYRIGMNGDAIIKIAEKQNVLTIPLDAISERDDQVFVEIKADNKEGKEERAIKVGLESEDEIEVLEGLTENDQVLLPE
jgi:HlyD family secretion protein